MRTTVEITDEQRIALSSLAARRGVRGFSTLVREAIDLYLAHQAGEDVAELLALEGALSDEDAAEVERRVAEAWSTWMPAS